MASTHIYPSTQTRLGGQLNTLVANMQRVKNEATNLKLIADQIASGGDYEPDERSVLFIDSETGLITVNGKPATDPIHAELDYTADILSIVVDACITAQLAKGTYIYGIQSVSASGDVLERYGGQLVVIGDVVRATE